MWILISILIFVFTLLGIFLIWRFWVSTHRSIRAEIQNMTDHLISHLQQTAHLTQQAGQGAIKAISDVYSKLGALEESSRKIYELGHEISKLQEVLRAPKARGGFGELMLADLLRQIIPQDHFQLQYTFRNGSRVDAAIFVGDHLVPIDAKFPLDNFQRVLASQSAEDRKKVRKEFVRDVKRHIDTIAARYIVPEEGTFDFALMYVPAENVYYELVASDEDLESPSLSSYALEQHVIPVSPNSFYAYLQVILLGLRSLRVDQAAREIAESMTRMQVDFKKIADDFGTLGTHLNHARGAYEKAQRGMDQFQIKLASVNQGKLVSSDEQELSSKGELKNDD